MLQGSWLRIEVTIGVAKVVKVTVMVSQIMMLLPVKNCTTDPRSFPLRLLTNLLKCSKILYSAPGSGLADNKLMIFWNLVSLHDKMFSNHPLFGRECKPSLNLILVQDSLLCILVFALFPDVQAHAVKRKCCLLLEFYNT